MIKFMADPSSTQQLDHDIVYIEKESSIKTMRHTLQG